MKTLRDTTFLTDYQTPTLINKKNILWTGISFDEIFVN
jgi:hypothetical protein